MNPKVDLFLVDGCGRCKYYQTPKCKVLRYTDQLMVLRQVLLESGLEEEVKWGWPTYTLDGKNVVIVHAFKEYCGLTFFKGLLMKDPKKILTAQSENVQGSRQIRFTDQDDLTKHIKDLKAYIAEAIRVEKSGEKLPEATKSKMPEVAELEDAFKKDKAFKNAFLSLTPGRQRAYLLQFSQAKQSATRVSRIEKARPAIMAGKGPND
jgi:uncharacterized protein YdeI (YjbR/CyaY-like superfamily)